MKRPQDVWPTRELLCAATNNGTTTCLTAETKAITVATLPFCF